MKPMGFFTVKTYKLGVTAENDTLQ
jgi:hypothetical protein